MRYVFHSGLEQPDPDVSKRRTQCDVAHHVILLVLFASGLVKGVSTGALTAQVPNMTVPAGGTAQIRVVLGSPQFTDGW